MREPVTATPDRWLRVEEAAHLAQCSTATVRRAIKARQLEAVRLAGGRRYRIRASAVDRWLDLFAAA